jgi:tetratricopeptide (TPR) repeat protein
MEDGSPFVVSMNPKLARITRAGKELDLPLAADSSIFAAASGPDDTLWLADATKGSIRILGSDGSLRDIIQPELPQGASIMRLRVLKDGGFLAATMTDLRRFDRGGRLLWLWNGKAEGLALGFSMLTDFTTGADGTVFVSDYLGKRVFRLAEPGARLPSFLARVEAANSAIRTSPGNPELILALADAYEGEGAVEAARAVLARYLEARPADAKAADRLFRLEARLLDARVASAETDTRELLARLGPESAREAYGRAMRSLEDLRSRLPDDQGIAARITALRALFQKAEGSATTSAVPLPRIAEVELAALFPSLLQAYRLKPAGSVLVKNTTSETLLELRAEIFVPKYMDYPSAGAVVARLAPGAEARLDISPLLNELVLEVQEDLSLQARIAVRYRDSGGERAVEISRPLTLYRRTAITWDDTGKIAGFITPNEETIARLSFGLLANIPDRPLLSTTFNRAMLLCDALGALPLRYVPDPQSPVTAALGQAGLVDTVRFPRTTLAYRGGDCDDTTALLASVLEAAGIATAILTSPGHIFLAFDTGEKEDGAWAFRSAGYETLSKGGKLWIPVETTLLAKGFSEAWKAASELVRLYRDGVDFEFLPLLGLRASYPPLPLPASNLAILGPDQDALILLDSAAQAQLSSGLYAPLAAYLEKARSGLQGAEWNRQSNRLAQLHARWNQVDKATALWSDILRRDATYLPAYLNLATASLQAKKTEEAVAWLRKADSAAPGSSLVSAWAVRSGFSSSLATGGALQAVGQASGQNGSEAPRSGGALATSNVGTAGGRAAGGAELIWVGD